MSLHPAKSHQQPEVVRHFSVFCIAGTVVALVALVAHTPSLSAAESTPVVRWDFGAEEATPLQSHGGVHRDVPGPRSPEYPDFAMDNTAVKLE